MHGESVYTPRDTFYICPANQQFERKPREAETIAHKISIHEMLRGCTVAHRLLHLAPEESAGEQPPVRRPAHKTNGVPGPYYGRLVLRRWSLLESGPSLTRGTRQSNLKGQSSSRDQAQTLPAGTQLNNAASGIRSWHHGPSRVFPWTNRSANTVMVVRLCMQVAAMWSMLALSRSSRGVSGLACSCPLSALI